MLGPSVLNWHLRDEVRSVGHRCKRWKCSARQVQRQNVICVKEIQP